jgi:hypothetical protein
VKHGTADRVRGLRPIYGGQIADRETMRRKDLFRQLSRVPHGVGQRLAGPPLQAGDGHRMNAAPGRDDRRPQPSPGYRIYDDRMQLDHPNG